MANIFAKALCYFRGDHNYETICLTCGKKPHSETASLLLFIKNNMATTQQLTDAFAQLSADLSTQLTAITTEVHNLKGTITSQNNSINAADLDPLLEKITAADALVKGFNPDTADTAPKIAPATPDAPTADTTTTDGGPTAGMSSVPA